MTSLMNEQRVSRTKQAKSRSRTKRMKAAHSTAQKCATSRSKV